MRVRTYWFPGVLRGLPGPRLATTPTNRPRRSLSSPGDMCTRSSIEAVCGRLVADRTQRAARSSDDLAQPKDIVRRPEKPTAVPRINLDGIEHLAPSAGRGTYGPRPRVCRASARPPGSGLRAPGTRQRAARRSAVRAARGAVPEARVRPDRGG